MKMGYDFVVAGGTGTQGKIVSKDLLERGYSVLLCGRNKKRVEHILKKYKKSGFECFDARDVKKTAETFKYSKANVCINCVEGDWDLNILKACVSSGLHCLDLGSEIDMTKQQFAMSNELKKKNLISLTGCGSVPGVGNVMLRYASEKFDKIDTIEVGFAWDSNIKQFVLPFSIESIMEEFTHPAPAVINGKFKFFKPSETIRLGNHRTIGPQNEFFTRHPEQYTFWHYFKKKGVKNIRFYGGFPKHSADKINALIDLGFTSNEPLCIRGQKISPVEFITELLKNLPYPKGYLEKENLWVKIWGTENGKKKTILMECLVPTLKGWEDAGCNIDTGIPASIMAQMIKKGIITARGSFSPEAENVVPAEYFFHELRKRQMKVLENGKVIN